MLGLDYKDYLVCLLGFFIGGCGQETIRFRPALIFQPAHANMFLEAFADILKEH